MLTNLCRLLLATVFIVSGFVKAVDPKGLLYKLQEYAAVFVPEVPIDDAWLLLLAVSLPAVEFFVGRNAVYGYLSPFFGNSGACCDVAVHSLDVGACHLESGTRLRLFRRCCSTVQLGYILQECHIAYDGSIFVG